MPNINVKLLDGGHKDMDMSLFKSVADGTSQIYVGWESTLIYSTSLNMFIELSEAPPDYCGNSEGETIQVEKSYAIEVYGIKIKT